jgi:hypothetical protein
MIGSLSPTGTSSTYVPTRAATTRETTGGAGARTENTTENTSPKKRTESELSEADRQKVNALKQTDRRVRAHEMAHVAAGGSLVKSGANFNYETGPDGQRYAVGGEVAIDASPGRSPDETIDKATRIKAAALAPAEPVATGSSSRRTGRANGPPGDHRARHPAKKHWRGTKR